MEFAPVVLFTYNRYDEIMQVVQALSENKYADETDVYVYSNAPDPNSPPDREVVQRIRQDLKQFKEKFKKYKIIEREVNNGPNGNMIPAIHEIINKYGKVIVIEDDIFTAKGFLKFMNEALQRYENDKDLFSICAYNPVSRKKCSLPGDTFTYDVFHAWGWATWKDRWVSFDMEEDTVSRIDLEKAAVEAQAYLPVIKDEMVYRANSKMVHHLDYIWTCKQLAERKTVLYPKNSYCDNIGIGTGITSYWHPSYYNHNFYKEFMPEKILFSESRLSLQNDPEYFFAFRDEEFCLRLGLDSFFRAGSRAFSVMYYTLALLHAEGYSIGYYFKKHKINKAAIYDWGAAGKLLYKMLKQENIDVSYILDRSGAKEYDGIPIISDFNDIEIQEKVDAIIVTEVRVFIDIQEELFQYTKLPIISLDNIIIECKVDLIDQHN